MLRAFQRQVSGICVSGRRVPLQSTKLKTTIHSGMSNRILDFEAGPLVWIDCEMTGLDHRKDKILEIAVLITDGKLELLDPGVEYVIQTDKESLDKMDTWCTRQHGTSGLTQACLDSPHTLSYVSQKVLEYVKERIPSPRVGVLAGNSVHVDRLFLLQQMPELVDWLHYRIVDVSSVKELCRRWYPELHPPRAISVKTSHRALDDIRGSIKELEWYRENVFSAPKTAADVPRNRSEELSRGQ
ncbi:ribonuclease H-like protein [Rickenella mellea]|uniref:Ribonuclease H-like protein n=1 Tax=Rickenella mellea TaxID=50990 RepID=A0A4Y7Q5W6_9AGAM|nr:ribonuclease H-like protein [Rickenella mellea]